MDMYGRCAQEGCMGGMECEVCTKVSKRNRSHTQTHDKNSSIQQTTTRRNPSLT